MVGQLGEILSQLQREEPANLFIHPLGHWKDKAGNQAHAPRAYSYQGHHVRAQEHFEVGRMGRWGLIVAHITGRMFCLCGSKGAEGLKCAIALGSGDPVVGYGSVLETKEKAPERKH